MSRSGRPIADYALISDCHSAALVSVDGSVDWLCLPRFDAPAVFAGLLDDEAGHWSIRPAEEGRVRRRYLDRTMVLETTFQTTTGTVVMTDAMAVGPNERGHELGSGAPHVVLRHLRCTDGHVEMETEYAPRPEYGLVHPLLRPIEGGLFGRGGASFLTLTSPVDLEVRDSTATARFTLRRGKEAGFALHHHHTWQDPPRAWKQEEIPQRLDQTVRAWETWSALHGGYQGEWAGLVEQGARVLQALIYQPTAAIVASPTTSLPEAVGGERNWDYRYAWIRDAALTIEALWVAACPDEARDFFAWVAGTVASQVRHDYELMVVFGVGGEHDLTERELPHLSGWRGSRPVRVGNNAWAQRQVDVYGEILSAAHKLTDQLTEVESVTREFLVGVADAACRRWTEEDRGIWEVRGDPRHFLHSKLMCWVAVDRAVELATFLGAQDRADGWREAREEIRRAIEERGWNDEVGAFTQSFDSKDLDASALLIPMVGFLPPDDVRVLSTIRAIEEHLTDQRGLVYRYRTEDGLEGEEGTFLLCTFWLANALALAGEVPRAPTAFERAASYANDLGLLSEEVDPATGELLGNFPQAYSHVGLINAAWAISEAERGRRGQLG